MSIELDPLPYPENALEPFISARTLAVHHGQHHRGYLERLNAATLGTALEHAPLEHIVRLSSRGHTTTRRVATFQNAAQAWNHQFFWRSLRPPGGPAPSPWLARRIARDFGSHANLATALKAAATDLFGSGWAWLVPVKGELRIIATRNADTPIVHGRTPLAAIDVWEHAYYLDVRNRRADYVAGVVDHLLDWDFVERNLRRAEPELEPQPPTREAVHA